MQNPEKANQAFSGFLCPFVNFQAKIKEFTISTNLLPWQKWTFDSYMYQLIENKQRFIAQIMTGKLPVRSAEDVDEQVLLRYPETSAGIEPPENKKSSAKRKYPVELLYVTLIQFNN